MYMLHVCMRIHTYVDACRFGHRFFLHGRMHKHVCARGAPVCMLMFCVCMCACETLDIASRAYIYIQIYTEREREM